MIDRHTQVGDVVRGNGKRLVWVVCFTLLVTMATSVVAVGVLFGAIMLGVALDSPGLAVLGFLGGLVLVVPVEVWLRVRTMLVPAGLMLEGGKFWATVARAWRLTRGSFWRLTGLYLLVWILTAVVSGIITVPGSMIASVVMDDPMLTSGGAIAVSAVSQVIALTLTTVFSAGVVALAYIDARMRREGLDVELARAMQASA